MGMRILVLIGIIALTACDERHGGPIGDHRYPPKAPDAPIQVFLTMKPDRPYEEVGVYRREADSNAADNVMWAQRVGRKVGGDAVLVNQNAGVHSETSLLWGTTSGGNMEDVIVIRWTDTAAKATP